MRHEASIFGKDNVEGLSKKSQLSHFLRKLDNINKNAYGEIVFIESGRKPTYSPYITVSHDIDPSIIWQLFTFYWKLFVPHIIITTIGNFSQHDYHWENITKNSWIFTKGSSPLCGYRTEACVVAIQRAKSFRSWKSLYSHHEHGLFPAHYFGNNDPEMNQSLDHHHSHFIFVEGSIEEVARFRKNLLDHFGSRPIEFDSTRTKYIQIPIVAKLTSDCAEEVIFAATCTSSKNIIVVHKNAERVATLLTKQQNAVYSTENEESEGFQSQHILIRGFLRYFKTDKHRALVREFLKKCLEKKVVVYPSATCFTLKEAIIKSLISSDRHCEQTPVRLALIWDRIDLISHYFSSKNIPRGDNVFFYSSLNLALTLNRGKFLELIHNSGINVYSCLTIRMLWNLYFKGMLSENCECFIPTVVTCYLKKKKFLLKNLMSEIGKLISELTNFECENIYDDPIYVYKDAEKHHMDTSFARNLNSDKTTLVPHPQRDLFIWCLLSENNVLSKVLWKHGSEQLALSVIASVVFNAQAKFFAQVPELSMDTQYLKEYSEEWESRASQFLQTSCRANEMAAQSHITANLPHLGNCSCITLAHGGRRHSFMAQAHIQRVLDLVWAGRIKAGTSFLKLFLGILFPIIIPFIDVMKTKASFSFFLHQSYFPLFSRLPSKHRHLPMPSRWHGKTLHARRDLSTNSSLGHVLGREWTKNFLRDISAFYHSPRIIFLFHTIFYFTRIFPKVYCKLIESVVRWKRGSMGWSIDFTMSLISRSRFNSHQCYVVAILEKMLQDYYLRLVDSNKRQIKEICLSISILLMSLSIITIDDETHHPYSLTGKIQMYWMAWYILGNFLEDIRTEVAGLSFRKKLQIWLSSVWNIFHLIAIICYFTGITLFLSRDSPYLWYVSTVLLSFTLIFLYMLALQAYSVSKLLGPILEMIRRMINDMIAFVAITGLLFFAYGVILSSLRRQSFSRHGYNSTHEWGNTFESFILHFANNILRRPFWQLFGDTLGGAEDKLESVPMLVEAIATGIYVCFTNILMINLLIAMLSYTFDKIRGQSYQVWAFHRFKLFEEFSNKPFLPSPFILIIHAYRFVLFLKGKQRKDTPFKRTLSRQELDLSKQFEAEVLEEFLTSRNPVQESSEETLNKLKEMQKKMEFQFNMMLNHSLGPKL